MLCQFIARAKHRLLTRDILNNRYTSIHLACRPLFCLRVAQLCITPLLICKNLCRSRGFRLYLLGGERGIRTPDTLLRYTHFPGALLKPLGHLSNISPSTKHLIAQKRAQDKNNFWFLPPFDGFIFSREEFSLPPSAVFNHSRILLLGKEGNVIQLSPKIGGAVATRLRGMQTVD